MIGTPASSVVTLTCADLDAVEALRERNTETLGFLAKGVLSHYLASGGGLGTKTPDGRLVAYQLFALHRRHIRIIHLCVAAEARGCGYAKALVDQLTDVAKQRDIGVVKLNCRRDYPAHSLWPKLGFVPLDEKPAKTPGRRLTQWYLAIAGHGERDLFHVAASDEKVNAVIDAHVFFHLHDPDGESDMVSKGLQADFLDDLLQLYITDEMFVEIDRDQSAARREASRRHAHSFPKVSHNHDKVSGFSSLLGQMLPTATHAQKSDISQLAKTAASDVRIFLTMDTRLLGAADRIQRAVGVRVLTPTELIVQLDEFTDPASYASTPLSGSNLTWRKLDHDALAQCPLTDFWHLRRENTVSSAHSTKAFRIRRYGRPVALCWTTTWSPSGRFGSNLRWIGLPSSSAGHPGVRSMNCLRNSRSPAFSMKPFASAVEKFAFYRTARRPMLLTTCSRLISRWPKVVLSDIVLPVALNFYPYMRSLHEIRGFQAEAACGSSSLPVRISHMRYS